MGGEAQRLGDLDDGQVGPGCEEVEDLIPGFSRTFYRTFYRTCRRSAVNRGGKQAAVSVIEKPNLRPFLQRPFDPRVVLVRCWMPMLSLEFMDYGFAR